MMITIRHTHADGTLIEGSRKGDGVYEILTGLRSHGQGNWRYFPSLRQIGLGQSRDKPAQDWKIQKAAGALRAAGHDVEIVIDNDTRRPFAEAEAERYERAETRADYHGEHAGSAAAAADAAWQAEHRILDGIPLGQPILIGHHSERRHRRDLERAEAHRRRGLAEAERSRYHADRAEAAGRYQAGRENLGTTLRRIEGLEAEARLIGRRLAGEGTLSGKPAEGGYRERLLARQQDTAEQLAYWRAHVAALEAAGRKAYGPADFAKGDWARDDRGQWWPVSRVNPKSLTVPHWFIDGASRTLPYSKVTGQRPAGPAA